VWGKWVIRLNVIAIALWYLLLPFAGKLSLFNLGGVRYDISRVIGLGIIYGNTLLLPTINIKKIPVLVLLSAFFFLMYAAILLFIGGYFVQSLNMLIRIYSGFLLFFIYCGFYYEHKMEIVEKLILVIGLYAASFTIIQFVLYEIDPAFAVSLFAKRAFVASYSTVRPQGPLLSAGGSASVMTIAFILILKKFLQRDLTNRHILIAVVMGMAMLLNLTRTYLFPLVIITIACLIFYRHFKALAIIISALFILIFVSFSFIPPSHYLDRFKDVPGFAGKNVSKKQMMQGRGLLVNIVWTDFKKKGVSRQIIGDGLCYTSNFLGRYFSVAEASTHNDFLWLLSNMGILGLLLYLIYYMAMGVSYQGSYKFLYLCYLFGIMFMSGLGGETINITGHRWLQVILLAYFFDSSWCNGALKYPR